MVGWIEKRDKAGRRTGGTDTQRGIRRPLCVELKTNVTGIGGVDRKLTINVYLDTLSALLRLPMTVAGVDVYGLGPLSGAPFVGDGPCLLIIHFGGNPITIGLGSGSENIDVNTPTRNRRIRRRILAFKVGSEVEASG